MRYGLFNLLNLKIKITNKFKFQDFKHSTVYLNNLQLINYDFNNNLKVSK